MPSKETKKKLRSAAIAAGVLIGGFLVYKVVRKSSNGHSRPPSYASTMSNNQVGLHEQTRAPTRDHHVSNNVTNNSDPAGHVWRDKDCWRDKTTNNVTVRNFPNGDARLTSDMQEAMDYCGIEREW